MVSLCGIVIRLAMESQNERKEGRERVRVSERAGEREVALIVSVYIPSSNCGAARVC